MTKRAGIYVRLSSDPRGIGRSVSEQEADSRADCEKRGWDIAAVYSDNNRSASKYATRDREQFLRLMDDIRSGQLDVIVAWEASRFVRDTKVYNDLADACVEHGVLMSYNGRVLDLSDPDDAFNAGLDNLLSVREAGITRKRIMRTHRFNAEAGLPHGQIAYGYRRIYDDRSGALLRQEPEPAESVIVREIFTRFIGGDSLYSVARSLTLRSVPTPSGGSTWTVTSLRRILERRQYLGKRVWKGRTMPDGGWEPLVDEVTFARCQDVLADPRRRSGSTGAVRHLLSGILTCDECEGRMAVAPRNGIPSYVCLAGHVARKKELIEEPLVRLVQAMLADPGFVDGATEDDGPLLDEIDRLDREIGSLVTAVEAGELSARMATAEERRLETRKAELLDEVRKVIALPMAAQDGQWDQWSLATRREVVRALFSSLRAVKKKGQTQVGRHAPGVLFVASRDPNQQQRLLTA